nr:uncharacterized protein LOC105345664 [Crassostrea gigas]
MFEFVRLTMAFVKHTALFLFFSVCLGCFPGPYIEQQDYCRSEFAFEANITSIVAGDHEDKYGIEVEIVYKGVLENISSTLDGFSRTCGKEGMELYTSYLIYAMTVPHPDYPNLSLVFFRKVSDITTEDIKRMTEKYDCGCKINFNEWSYFPQQDTTSRPLLEPTADACIAPRFYCRRSAFCQKNSEGICTWGDLGVCDYLTQMDGPITI